MAGFMLAGVVFAHEWSGHERLKDLATSGMWNTMLRSFTASMWLWFLAGISAFPHLLLYGWMDGRPTEAVVATLLAVAVLQGARAMIWISALLYRFQVDE
jgi:hypothetical protein